MPRTFATQIVPVPLHLAFPSHIDTQAESHAINVYVDLDGTIKPRRFSRHGMWRFDGQFYMPPSFRTKAINKEEKIGNV